jgi:S-adenosylmethionine:diacylglycerol 3-amino-3-carboxypropyl transferase
MSSTHAATAWQSGRFRAARAGKSKLLFGWMHEDSEIERRVFQPGGRIFCIASGGCTAMRLAVHHTVAAVDINPVQVGYVRQRLAGGKLQRGSAERILAFARSLAPLAGWNKRTVQTFLELDRPPQQILYWRRHMDTRRFRAAFSFLFSRLVLRSVYSTALLTGLPPDFGTVLRGRMERCFALHPNRENPYAHALLLGDMCSAPNPPDPAKIELQCADAAEFLEGQAAGSFTAFSLSNILDGANPVYAQRLFAAVRRAAAPGAKVVLRSFRQPECERETNHASEDRAMLWGIVDVRRADTL